jgi:hypothetical protein
MSKAHYQIIFYVPVDHCEKVKNALFAAGAGKLGDYQQCAWQTLGQGQFKPIQGSQPFIGKQDKVEIVEEYKVEMICAEQVVADAIKALIEVHPYEEPAYFVVENGAF